MYKYCGFNYFFNKFINIIITVFFFFSLLSTLYVFTYPFEDNLKIYIFIVSLILFCIIVYLSKEKVEKLLNSLFSNLEKMNYKTMLHIIIITMVVLKALISLTCFFDPTVGEDGDIVIYNQLAESLVNTGKVQNNEIAHLIGVSSHLALLKLLNIPYHIGIFILFLIATIINFFSFKNIIGKEKTFLALMFYILMPSTTLLTFCPTHELFLYLYISISLFALNKVLSEDNLTKQITYCLIMTICIVLGCFVNPACNVLLIIIILIALLSNVIVIKKGLLILVVVISLITSNIINNQFGVSKLATDSNTYSILIHGSSVESRGEHVDKYPAQRAREYLKDNGIEYTFENQLLAYKAVLLNQYKYLFTHPIEFAKLLAHKFYIEWSGDHYSIEMAYNFGAISDIIYYLFLGLSALIYLFVLTLGLIFYKKKNNSMEITNYMLFVLGIVAMLLITLVLNKYSVYVTVFIYLIAFYRLDNTNLNQ